MITQVLATWYQQKYSLAEEEGVVNYAPPAEQWDTLDTLESMIRTDVVIRLPPDVTPEALVHAVMRYKKTQMTPQQQALVPNAAVVLSERFASPIITTARYLTLYSVNSPGQTSEHRDAEIPSVIGYPVDPAPPDNALDLWI